MIPVAADVLILSNGPGEVTTWVRPVLIALRQALGQDRDRLRISLILSPCVNGTGQEVAIAQRYPELDRVQGAEHFFPFLLFGKTVDSWDWRDRGVVIFLGGDQLFPVIIGRRLGYRTVIYGEWDTRWHPWIDRFGVMNASLVDQAPARYRHKFAIVGDLMAEVGQHVDPKSAPSQSLLPDSPLIGLLPGSKPAKLAQGVPLCLAIAQQIQHYYPNARFAIPVAPTLNLKTLAKFSDPEQNPVSAYFGSVQAHLNQDPDSPTLATDSGLTIQLWTDFPAYPQLVQCDLCLTTIGANTAELGSLAVPMIVLLPTQQLDAMRAWDGLPGLLANLPGIGSLFATRINRAFLRKSRLLAWPNIWAGRAIVPEILGELQPQQITDLAVDLLNHPEKLEQMRQDLRAVRGESGAAQKLTQLVQDLLA